MKITSFKSTKSVAVESFLMGSRTNTRIVDISYLESAWYLFQKNQDNFI